MTPDAQHQEAQQAVTAAEQGTEFPRVIEERPAGTFNHPTQTVAVGQSSYRADVVDPSKLTPAELDEQRQLDEGVGYFSSELAQDLGRRLAGGRG